MVGARFQPFQHPVIHLDVVGLEDVVPAVVAGPGADVVAAGAGCQVHGHLDPLDRIVADARIRRGQRAPAPFRVCPDFGDHTGKLEAGIVDLLDDGVLVLVVDVPAADNLDAGEAGHLLGVRQHLIERAWFGIALDDITVGAQRQEIGAQEQHKKGYDQIGKDHRPDGVLQVQRTGDGDVIRHQATVEKHGKEDIESKHTAAGEIPGATAQRPAST